MKGPLKIVLGAVAVLFLVVVLLTVVVLMVFDPDDYQQMMTDAVFDQTGRTLVIDGGLSIDTLPCCSVELERGRLGNPAGFPDGDFIRVESVRLGLRLWPLLVRQEIVIGDIGLDGLELTLLRREDGSANWDFETGGPAEPVETTPDDAAIAIPPLSAGGLTISDARVTFRDMMSGADYRVDDFDLQTGAVSVGQPVDIEMAFQVTDVAGEMSVQGELSLAAKMDFDTMRVALENVTADVAVNGAGLPGDGLTLSARIEAVDVDLDSGTVTITNQRASVAAVGAVVTINASGTVVDGAPDLSGTLSLEPVSPRRVLRALDQPDIVTSDPEALSNLQAAAKWSIGSELLVLDDIDLRLDDTKINGRLQINYLDQSGLKFDFIADQLAIDRYLAPDEENAGGGGATEPAGPTEVPVDTVRELDFSGHVRLGRLTMDALLLENLDAQINASGGRVRLDPMTADLYGGRYSGAVTIDVRGQKPSVSFRQTVTNVQAAGLMTDLADTSNLEGVLEASFTGKGVGRTDNEIIETLAGDVSFNLANGVYKGVDVWYEIRKARALLKGKPGPTKSADPETPIEALTFTGRIDDGVLTSKTMVAQIPFMRLNGNGAVNLAEETMNFRFQASVHEKPEFPDGEDLAGLQGLMIPLTVTGAVASPSVGVDLGELVKSEATRQAKGLLLDKLGLSDSDEEDNEGADEPKKEDARDMLKKGLRGLFGR